MAKSKRGVLRSAVFWAIITTLVGITFIVWLASGHLGLSLGIGVVFAILMGFLVAD